MLEPIYQRQHDTRSEVKELKKNDEAKKKRQDEHDFMMHKQAKRIENVERLWEKITDLVGCAERVGAETKRRRE